MDKKSFDVTTLGELLIDFTENGSSSQGNPLLEANPGGAVCNVLAMLEKLGKKTAYIGKVGQDMFGTQLKEAVEEVGIDTRNLIMDPVYHTTLAFVHTYPDGDRDFSFYRDPGADMMLTKEEVSEELIRDSRIFLPIQEEVRIHSRRGTSLFHPVHSALRWLLPDGLQAQKHPHQGLLWLLRIRHSVQTILYG